jgi:hypothetical protein
MAIVEPKRTTDKPRGILADVLDLAAFGWRVIPLHNVTDAGECSCATAKGTCDNKPGKHPRTPHGLKDGTTDPDQIRRWWDRWPLANPAVCTGATSGVFIVGPDGAAGMAALADLERRHGHLPRTATAKTGGGGKHYYFRWPAEGTVPNRRNHRGLPIDVRGAGGYVVAPPGRNKDGPYTWEVSLHEAEVAEAPAWLLEWCREDGAEKATPPTAASSGKVTATSGTSIVDRAIKYLSKVPPAISGQGGHNQTMEAARVVCWGFDLGKDVGYQILDQHYNPRCRPPWSERDLRHKCHDADTKDFGKPRGWLLNGDRTYTGNGQATRATGNGAAPPNGEDADCGDAWEPPPGRGPNPEPQPEPPPRAGWTFKALDSGAFAALDCRPTWLVKGIAVADQPGIWGGPRKALKTTAEIDFVVSLGSGKPFLGTWEIPKPLRTLLLSGESGEWAVQETGRRVCEAKGIQLKDVDVLWQMDLPQLSNLTDMAELRHGLEQHRVKVAVIDPLYLCCLAGQPDVSAANLFEMGPLLLNAARACLSVGCTPFLVHHARKNLAHPFAPMELEDLAFSGIQEFARQWLLLSRREPYQHGTGSHRLWLQAGGSVGFGGCWAVDVEEGVIDEHFRGRGWEVTVTAATEARARIAEAGDQKKQEQQDRKDKADDAAVLSAIDYLMKPRSAAAPRGRGKRRKKAAGPTIEPQAPTRRAVQAQARLSPPRLSRAVNRLLDVRLIEEVEVVLMVGRGNKTARKEMGLRRPKDYVQGEAL